MRNRFQERTLDHILRDRWEYYAGEAWNGFLSEGRGALVFWIGEATESGVIPGHYVCDGGSILRELGGWPNEIIATAIQEYTPELEVVLLITSEDNAVDCYLVTGNPAPSEACNARLFSLSKPRVDTLTYN
jgi:hypothetical protein